MRIGKFSRYVAAVLCMTLVFTSVFFCLEQMDVSAGTPSDTSNDFVNWDTQLRMDPAKYVTSEGGNTKKAKGSGISPNDSVVVPTCVGTKGTESNPFVVLEIVANHADQQMAYLGQDENSTYDDNDNNRVLDMMQIGIDLSKKKERVFRNQGDHISTGSDYLQITSSQNWFNSYKYSVYKTDGSGDVETKHYAEVDMLYSYTITEATLKEKGISVSEFSSAIDNVKTDTNLGGPISVYDVSELMKKYPSLFAKEDYGRSVRSIALNDKNNWEIEKKNNAEIKLSVTIPGDVLIANGVNKYDIRTSDIVKNSAYDSYFKSVDSKYRKGDELNNWTNSGFKSDYEKVSGGYLTYVGTGSGDYNLNIYSYADEYGDAAELKANVNGSWKYSKSIPEGVEEKAVDWSLGNNQGSYQGSYVAVENISTFFNKPVVRNKGDYVIFTFEGGTKSAQFNIIYYGLKNNNILKRQLFNYKSEEEYDNFKMKVIVMTPEEINKNVGDGDESTIDIIERADMFYIGGYGVNTDDIKSVHDVYNNYAKNTIYEANQNKTFKMNDLDWIGCYKILYRLCTTNTLPLINTAELGKSWTDGNKDATVYMKKRKESGSSGGTLQYEEVSRNSTICNLAKLYLVTMQFNLTAKKSPSTDYERTFFDDIINAKEFWLGKIDRKSTITVGGYYEKEDIADKDTNHEADYLWNSLTFLPANLDVWSNGSQIKTDDDTKELFRKYGYSKFYLDSSTPGSLFDNGDENAKTTGTDGSEGNVGLVGGKANTNFSTLLGATPSAGVNNVIMQVAYTILNAGDVSDLLVEVVPQVHEYVKISNSSVLVDYISKNEYNDEKSYVKVKISCPSGNTDGVVQSVEIAKNKESKLKSALYKDKDGKEEYEIETIDTDKNGTVRGYIVPENDGLIAYIPYSLKDWADGYNKIEITSVGRAYNNKQKGNIHSDSHVAEIIIDERGLFDLE